MRSAWLIGCFVTAAAVADGPAVSKWAYLGSDHRLHYQSTPRGDRIMDFSYAGYRGGGVVLPTVRVVRSLKPMPGDNTAQIQAAIDAVGRQAPGAVLLSPGVYEVERALTISMTGVVLRGSGSGEGGTVIRLTGAPHRLLEVHGTGSWRDDGTAARITNDYVASGADAFDVDDAASFHVGDAVLVRRPVTAEWIHFMAMDTLVRDGKKQTWIRAGTSIRTDRTIKAISGNRITLDVPLSDSLDSRFLSPESATLVKYAFPGRIREVGVESMRISAPATDVPITGPQYTFLRLDAVSDAWVRDVAVDETQNGVTLGPGAKRVTLRNVAIRHSIPHSGAAAPADFSISGTQVLLDRCSVSGKGTWPVVTQATVTGPNVVLRFRADEAGVSPHQRWATGLLVDSCEFHGGAERRPGIAFSNRKTAGSGHGWDIGWAVAWNVTSDFFLVQRPPGVINWCIGCVGKMSPSPDSPNGIFDAQGSLVTPGSLYEQQLSDRLLNR
jgi:hypothetical protein